MMQKPAIPFVLDRATQRLQIKKRSDRMVHYFLPAYFLGGLAFAGFYDTWLIAAGVGGLCLLGYYTCKMALPQSNLYQYVLSAVLGTSSAGPALITCALACAVLCVLGAIRGVRAIRTL